MTTDYLSDYIINKATPPSRSKGKALYREKAVSLISYGTQGILAKVRGGSLYSVTVLFAGNKITRTNCSCPYDFTGICKHIVAAIYKAIEHDEFDEEIHPGMENSVVAETSKPLEKIAPSKEKQIKVVPKKQRTTEWKLIGSE
ncbi:MAG TPA: hypothetical protein DCQ31_16105, partial [Bacteroidales bacterium]|nr:hypothetical protein [Bacteroidales bacterium]